jgi:hypothetical protein
LCCLGNFSICVGYIPLIRWQDKVRDGGGIVGGEGWQEKVHNREEWKKLLRTARNCCILHMLME